MDWLTIALTCATLLVLIALGWFAEALWTYVNEMLNDGRDE